MKWRPSRSQILIVTLNILVVIYLWGVAERSAQSDFNVSIHAGAKLLEGMNLYHGPLMDGAQYYYSPFFALLLSPAAYFGGYQELLYSKELLAEFIERANYVEFIWLLLGLFFLHRIVRLLKRSFSLAIFEKKEVVFLLLLTYLFVARSLDYNFQQVQMTIFLLWASLESVFLINSGRKVGGAAVLALAVNIKILPLLLIPYLLYRKEFKAVIWVLAFLVVLLFVPALFIGWEFNQLLLSSWFEIMNPIGKVNISTDHIDTHYGFHSIGALVTSLFTDTQLEIRTHIVDIGYDSAAILAHSLRLVMAFGSLYFLRSLPFKKAKSHTQVFYELSYILAVTPLIFPHQQKYSFFYLLPAIYYILYFLFVQRKAAFEYFRKARYVLIVLLMAVMFILSTVSSDLFIGKDLNFFTQYLKFITWGALVLLIPLVLCKPADLEQAVLGLQQPDER